MRKYLCSLIALTITLTIPLSNQVQAEIFAGYDSFCGLPVEVGNDAQIASARTDRFGNPIIHIDPGAMSNWTVSRMFALAHECAHHKLGHTSALGQLQRYSGGTSAQELEADCWAVQQLRDANNIFDITRMVIINASQGNYSVGGYPSGTARANNLLSCSGCNAVTNACMHAAHPFDNVPCTHIIPAHPNGDVYPCQHPCPGPFGPVPCHPMGDIVPCQHPVAAHNYDQGPCNHPAHPQGDIDVMCN